MYCVRKVTDDLYWVGADDHRLARFENFHPIPRGISYNAYLLMDEKTVLFDTVDWSCCRQLMENLEHLLAGRPLDYLVIDHVEPDHGAAIREVLFLYPNVRIICSKMGAKFLNQFGFSDSERLETVADGNTRCFGKHEVQFFTAPMVHWPEVIVSFDQTNGVLFSADAFGSFSALDGKLFNDEVDYDRDWIDETRRYYTNIVGKYGPQVQDLLKKTCCLDIKMICPLHGLVWRSNLPYLMDKHDLSPGDFDARDALGVDAAAGIEIGKLADFGELGSVRVPADDYLLLCFDPAFVLDFNFGSLIQVFGRAGGILKSDDVHGLQQRGLRPGDGAVDLVGQQQVRHNGTAYQLEFAPLLVVDIHAHDVGGQEVGCKLNPFEVAVQHQREGLDQRGLAHARQVFQQDMALGENRRHHEPDLLRLSHDDFFRFLHHIPGDPGDIMFHTAPGFVKFARGHSACRAERRQLPQ